MQKYDKMHEQAENQNVIVEVTAHNYGWLCV